jgi:hypothetical protein
MKSKRIIELCGFPASGKSYAISSLSSDNLTVITTEEFYEKCPKFHGIRKNITNIKFVILNFLLVIDLFLYVLTLGSKKGFKRYLKLIRYLVIYDYVIRNENSSNGMILDQGLIQYLWSLSSYEKETGIKQSIFLKASVKRIFKKYKFIVIYYKVSSELAAQRATNRNGDCTIDKLGYNVIKKLYEVHKDDFNILMSYLPKSNKYIVESVEEITEIIKLTPHS